MGNNQPEIPQEFHHLFEDRTHAHIATTLPDGNPHATPTWIDHDGEYVLVNTFRGSRKERNVKQNPHIIVSMTDPEQGNRFLVIHGKVAEITEEGADEHINQLSQRYLGEDTYPGFGGSDGPRVLLKVRPNRVIS
ncbi:PPOX class F420-dependent oxidoreductase [Halococcus sp. IIIV-5B]|uniref:PPOX class F420-dependent oxidoreductase n=1 Tax=Halococcus sp. IIIV-5B TaxID=2321230 RepID=UPI000E74FEED|nr:PPOX class F420-dependent oxidoreductase [Halococcus sp. IIIV-5B]RJT07143.1 PPOX class F420-dependent oxidoreductase [Halococcus sp. IIIV-5B]